MKLEERCKKHIKFSYNCFDRIKINGYITYLQQPSQLVYFLNNIRSLTINPINLKMATEKFITGLKAFANAERIPIIDLDKDDNKNSMANKYYKKNKYGIICIIKAQENSSCFGSYQNRKKTHTTITRVKKLVNNYYIYINDPEFGLSFLKICSYLPFNLEIYINGHNFIEQQLKKKGIKYTKIDNCFTYVSDLNAFYKICNQLKSEKITKFIDKWVYQFITFFRPFERSMGYKYKYYFSQVEYCNNIVFNNKDYLNGLFDKIIDNNKHIGRPDTISTVFKKNHTKRSGIPHRTLIQQGEKPCVKSWYKSSSIKQYNKKGKVLRTELTLNNTKDLYINKGISNIDYIKEIGDNINKRYIEILDEISLKDIGLNTLEKLAQTTAKGKKSLAGIKLENKRIMGVLKAILKNSFVINGFTNRELRNEIQKLLELSDEEYNASKMRYDLEKLMAKGIVKKSRSKNRYILSSKKYKVCAFLVRVYDIICRKTLNYLSNNKKEENSVLNVGLDVHLGNVDNAIYGLMNAVGITA